MSAILDRYGDYRGISRGALLEVLTRDGCDVTPGTTVTALTETPDAVRATLATPDGPADLDVDLVIVCDGLHSTTRDLIRPRLGVQTVDPHWAGWVAWAPADGESDLGEELWGAGFFLGGGVVAGRGGAARGGRGGRARRGAPGRRPPPPPQRGDGVGGRGRHAVFSSSSASRS
jgi:2-polyprenyl-6-methoxyphenol hydroxylase-like FAD-dependent oxidoreductase